MREMSGGGGRGKDSAQERQCPPPLIYIYLLRHLNFDLSFLEFLTNIKVIESEGADIDGEEMWVTSYEVSTSNNSKTWTTYSDGSVTRVIF